MRKRRLIRWARAGKLTTGHVAAARWNGPAQLLDHEHRWDTARRLLHDDDLKPEDRLAGLLVLLYAQGATAISRMTVEQIRLSADGVHLRLDRVPIQLPEPVAALARTVVANRKGHATIGARQPSPWLFPGGQPGRPISTARLTSRLPRARHPPRPGPQHRAVPARRRDPGRHPRPHPGHQHRRRRHLATPLRGRLDYLRRRRQPAQRHRAPLRPGPVTMTGHDPPSPVRDPFGTATQHATDRRRAPGREIHRRPDPRTALRTDRLPLRLSRCPRPR